MMYNFEGPWGPGLEESDKWPLWKVSLFVIVIDVILWAILLGLGQLLLRIFKG
jgi:hypothetical protein